MQRWRWLWLSNVYIALGAAGLCWASRVRLGGDLAPDAVEALVFLGTLGVYGLERVVGEAGGDASRARWVGRHRRLALALSGACLLTAAWPAASLSAAGLGVVGVGAVLSLAYCVPVVPWRTGSRWRAVRLARVPMMKLPAVAGVWVLGTAVLPAAELWADELNRITAEPGAIGLALERGLWIAALTLPFEQRDVALDRQAGIRTLPMVLRPGALRGLALGLTLAATCLAAMGSNGVWCWAVVLLAAPVVDRALRSPPVSEDYCSAVIDGLILLYGLSVILGVSLSIRAEALGALH